MSFLIGEIVANVRADSGQFRREMGNVQRTGATASRNTQRSLGGIGQKLTSIAFLAKTAFGSALVMGARQAVREFAMLEGAMAKFNVVFGDQARDTEAWIDTLRQRVPLARRELIAAAASMQDLLVPMGVAREEATGMTKEWLELAAALAAFNDVPVDQALEAIRSGIAGQSRPLRQFGIDVRETALQQTALEEGLIKSGEAMTETARQQALLLQAYRQSKDAIDGYEDQLGSTLMMEQELGAQFKDTMAIIGEELQPAYNGLLRTMTAVFDLMKENRSEITWAITNWAKLATIIPRTWTGWITGAIQSRKETNDLNKAIDDFLRKDISDIGFNELAMALGRIQEKMHEMREIAQGYGVDVETLDGYRELQGHFNVLAGILATVGERLDQVDEKSGGVATSLAYIPRTVGELGEEISELEDKIKNSFDPEAIARYQHEIKALEIEIAKLTGTFESLKPVIENTPPLYDHIFPPDMPVHRIISDLEIVEQSIADIADQWEQFDVGDKIESDLEKATGAGQYFSRTLADGLDQVLFRARSVEDAIKGIIRQLASRAFTTGIMGLLGGGLGAGGFLGAMFGGNRQSGGGVNPGRGYIVGERGPELFLPQSSGTIVPNDMGSKTINLNVHVKGGTGFDGKQLRYVIDEQVRQSVRLQ